MLTCVSEDLGGHGVGSQVVEDVALVNTDRGNNITSSMHSHTCNLASVRVEASDFSPVLKDLHRPGRRSNNSLVAGPSRIGDGTICLQSLHHTLLRKGVNTNHTINTTNKSQITGRVDRQSAATGVKRVGGLSWFECGDSLS